MRHYTGLAAFAAVVMGLLALPVTSPAVNEEDGGKPADGHGVQSREEAAKSAEESILTLSYPEGMEVSIFAAEPDVNTPVAFCFDEQGRMYVAESFRQSYGVEDNRGKEFWLLDDLAAQTVADRLAYFEKWSSKFEGGMDYFRKYDERIRLLEDTNGDGRADKVTMFAEGFNDPMDGTGAGVLARDGKVYYTCIPNLWLLEDKDGDGVSDERKVLHTGFGVRVALRGHDMHGLIWGPDGKLYWSIGDRGYNLETPEGKHYVSPGSGAVFRCDPDGSNLEVFHHGLRNPQELAFDQYGNLFAGDNNSDAGDAARLVYCVEGGETGWHMSYQSMGKPYERGTWHMDKLWHPQHPGQAAWILPPVSHINSGPSGFAYYPGVGLSERYDEHFFLCDYRGGARARSGVQSFAVEPDGATFTLVDHHQFIGQTLAVDVDFGYDGRVYVADMVQGWGMDRMGRVYKMEDPKAIQNPAIKETVELFKNGFDSLAPERLAELLHHPDMRVRLRAQFTLAKDLKTAEPLFLAAAEQTGHRLERFHGLWGLGMLARQEPSVLGRVLPMLGDADAEVRTQAAKVLGDNRYEGAAKAFIEHLTDENARVRFYSGIGLSRLGVKDAIEPALAMLRENRDRDVYLRHAGVMALVGTGDADALLKYADDENRSARMGNLLALRRLEDPRIAKFLEDEDGLIVLEAARAINDVPITGAMPALADLAARYEAQEKIENAADAPTPRLSLVRQYKQYGEEKPVSQEALETEGLFKSAPKMNQKDAFTSLDDQYFRKEAGTIYTRLAGYVVPRQSGEYTFYVSGNKEAALYLSPNDKFEDRQKIAFVSGGTDAQEWDKSETQTSKAVTLEAGKRYYIEARSACPGLDTTHVSVAWKQPDGSLESPIGGVGLESLLRRVVNANFRTGGKDRAEALAKIAARPENLDVIRQEALAALGDWAEPNPRDRVLGYYRPIEPRDASYVGEAMKPWLKTILVTSNADIQAEALRVAALQGVEDPGVDLASWVAGNEYPEKVRVEALRYLAAVKSDKLQSAVDAAMASKNAKLSAEAASVVGSLDPAKAVPILRTTLENGSTAERQLALANLAKLQAPEVNELILDWMQRLLEGKVPGAVQLDVLEAARSKENNAALQELLTKWNATLEGKSLPEQFAVALQGGKASEGKTIFSDHQAAQCMRCHKIKGTGGDAGPDLTEVGKRLKREDILQSLLEPSAQIAEGFEMAIITQNDGSMVAGTVTSETDAEVVITPPASDEKVTVKKADIKDRQSQKVSAMPPMATLLKPTEIRDLVAYLSSLKG